MCDHHLIVCGWHGLLAARAPLDAVLLHDAPYGFHIDLFDVLV
jgi:hypothetical protein